MAGRVMSSLQSTVGITCMKSLLMVFNFIFWLSGIAILAVGIWMKVQLYIYMELTTIYYNEAPYVLIGVGAFIVVIGSLGCLCTVKGHSIFLYLFAGFLMVIFVVELCVGISGFVYRSKLEDGFKNGLQDAIDQYNTDKEKKNAMDGLQEALSCCGDTVYQDWYGKYGDDGKSVPPSCCKNKESCKNTALGPTDDIYTEGCYDVVTVFMGKNFGIIGGVAIGFAFLQLFGALLACCLAKNLSKAKYEQVA